MMHEEPTETVEPAEGEKGIRGFPICDHNPFLAALVIPTRNKTIAMSTGKQLGLFDRETGEVLDDTAFTYVRQRVDTEEFVKIYRAHIRALFDLSPRAMRVLGYLMEATRTSNDTVIFNLKKCQQYTSYTSKGTISAALAELLGKDFIARTDAPNLYYINPKMFFNGDRVVMMRDLVRKGSKADRELQENDPLDRLAARALPELDRQMQNDQAKRRRLSAGPGREDEPPLPLTGGGMADGSKEESDAA